MRLWGAAWVGAALHAQTHHGKNPAVSPAGRVTDPGGFFFLVLRSLPRSAKLIAYCGQLNWT